MTTEQDSYRALVEGLPEPVARLDPDMRVTYANEAFCRHFVGDREALIGRSVLTLVPESDRERLANHFASLDAEHPVGRFASDLSPLADGPRGQLLVNRAVRDDEGNLLEYHTLIQDYNGENSNGLVVAREAANGRDSDGPTSEVENRFQSVVHHSSEIVKIVDLDGTLKYASPAFGRVLGYDPQEVLGANVLDYVHPDDLPRVLEETERASKVEGTPSSKAEYRFRHKDGSWRWIESVGTYMLHDPVVGGVLINARDVTERKAAEAALKKSEEYFRTLIHKVSDIITLYEPDGTIRYTSPALKRSLGYEPEERIGGNVFELVHPDDVAEAKRAFADVLRRPNASASLEVRVRHRDGSWRFLEATGTNLLDDPNVRAVVLNGRDVTESKQAEEALRKAEKLYRTLVEQVPAVTYVDRADGSDEPLYTSPRIEEMLGYTSEEWLNGRLWSERLHPEDRRRVLAADERFEAGEASFSEEYRLVAKDGSVVWVREDAELVSDEAGRPLYWQGVMFDITESKEAEEAVRWSERRFSSLVRNAADIIMVVGEDGRIRYISPAVGRVLGYDPDWVEGRDAFEIVHTDDVVRVRESVARTADGPQEALTMEVRLKHADGTWRHMESTATNLLNDPAVRGVVVNSRDVTERKKYEEALSRSESNLAEAQRMALLGNWEHDHLEGRVHWSDELYRVLGFVPGEVEPGWETFLKRVHPEDREGVSRAYREAVRRGGNDSTEYRVVWPDGSVRIVHNRRAVVLGPGGETVKVTGTVQDVTEQKKADLAIREAEERFRSLVEQVPPIIYMQEPEIGETAEYRTTYMSPRVEEVLGYPSSRFQEDTGFWNSLVHPDDLERVVAEDARTDETGEPFQMEYRMIHHDGRILWVRDEAVLIVDAADEPLYWQGALSDVTERKGLEAELERRAFHDPLTNLPNRALFANRLAGALQRTRRSKKKVAVLFIDLNGFKVVNDSLGHEAGDLLIVIVGQRLRRSLRPEDALARFGGDEFVVLLEDVEGFEEAAQVSERVTDELKKPFAIEGQNLFMTASIGIALGDARASTAEDLLRNADTAMYRAKEEGIDYRPYDPTMHERVLQRLGLQNDLRRAVTAGEFTVRYQPIVDLRTGLAWGTEALMRWDHPERGLLEPSEFMSAAENNGLILPLGETILEEACGQTRRWQQDHHLPSLTASVNLSAKQLGSRLVSTVRKTLHETGLDADRLSLDVTESAYQVLEDRTAFMDHLKALGVQLSIDDFGVGYSSLFHLKRLPADTIKVDKALTRGLGEDPEDTAILRMVVDLAHMMGIKVIAEGVEDAAQLAQLQEMNCDLAQGFLFCGPRSAEEIGPLLASGRLF